MLLATIYNRVTGESRQITRCKGASAPACLQFSDNVLGYWETRLELFEWATEEAGWFCMECDFIDALTGEVLTLFDLCAEDYEIHYYDTEEAKTCKEELERMEETTF